jgi:hypothetical protein
MPMTFDELCERCTPDERKALAEHLAMLRMRATLELAKEPPMPTADDEAMVKAAMRFAESQGFVIAENDYEAETRYGDFCAGWHAARKTPNTSVQGAAKPSPLERDVGQDGGGK